MKLLTIEDVEEIPQFAKEIVATVNEGYVFMHEVPDKVHGTSGCVFLFTSELRLTEEEVKNIYERLAYND